MEYSVPAGYAQVANKMPDLVAKPDRAFPNLRELGGTSSAEAAKQRSYAMATFGRRLKPQLLVS